MTRLIRLNYRFLLVFLFLTRFAALSSFYDTKNFPLRIPGRIHLPFLSMLLALFLVNVCFGFQTFRYQICVATLQLKKIKEKALTEVE